MPKFETKLQRPSRMRRSIVCAGLAAPFVLAGGRRSFAQSQITTLVVPYVPGGAVDTFARMFAKAYSEQIGATVVVENRGGASGTIGLARVANAVPDGRTLLYTYGNLALAAMHTVKGSPNVMSEITPIARSVITQGLIVTGLNSRFRTFEEVLKEAGKFPQKITFADYGELAISRLMFAAKIKMMRVPYKGGGPGLMDTIAGQVDLYAGSASATVPQVLSGKVRALAITSPQRMPQLRGVPTVREVIPNFTALNYQGVFGPKNIPAEVLNLLERQALAAIDSPAYRGGAEEHFANVDPMGVKDFVSFMRDDAVEIGKVVQADAER